MFIIGLGTIYNILWLKTQSWSGKYFHECLKLSDGTRFLFHIILCRHLVMLQYSSFVIPSMQSCHSGSGSSSIERCTKRRKIYTSPIHQSNTSVSYVCLSSAFIYTLMQVTTMYGTIGLEDRLIIGQTSLRARSLTPTNHFWLWPTKTLRATEPERWPTKSCLFFKWAVFCRCFEC